MSQKGNGRAAGTRSRANSDTGKRRTKKADSIELNAPKAKLIPQFFKTKDKESLESEEINDNSGGGDKAEKSKTTKPKLKSKSGNIYRTSIAIETSMSENTAVTSQEDTYSESSHMSDQETSNPLQPTIDRGTMGIKTSVTTMAATSTQTYSMVTGANATTIVSTNVHNQQLREQTVAHTSKIALSSEPALIRVGEVQNTLSIVQQQSHLPVNSTSEAEEQLNQQQIAFKNHLQPLEAINTSGIATNMDPRVFSTI